MAHPPYSPGPAYPPYPSAPPSLSAGALVILITMTVLALPGMAWNGFAALLLTEPPECFMTLTDAGQALCERARAEGWSLVPSFVLAGLAVLPVPVVIAAWLLRRRALARWGSLALVIALPVLGTVLSGAWDA